MIRISRGVPKFNIQIGPIHEAPKYNPALAISVTDAFEWSLMQMPHFYWLPINELAKTWGYLPFYAVKKILDFWCFELPAESRPPLIYVGCSAGAHRSPMSVYCWLLSHGYPEREAASMFFGKGLEDMDWMYRTDIKEGYVPPDLPNFYEEMRNHPEFSYRNILQSLSEYERISYSGSKLVLGL